MLCLHRDASREPRDRRPGPHGGDDSTLFDTADPRHRGDPSDERYPQRGDGREGRDGRAPSPSHPRGPRDRSMDRHHREPRGVDKQGFRLSPDRSKDSYDGQNNTPGSHGRRDRDFLPERRPERLMRGHGADPYEQYSVKSSNRLEQYEYMESEQDRLPENSNRLDPSSAVSKSARSRRKLESMLRNDSLSSDPSDCVRPPPPKPHKHKKGKKLRQASLSSSDSEIVTTPECTSDDLDIESESVSEIGKSGTGI